MTDKSMQSHEAFMAFERERLSHSLYRSDSDRGLDPSPYHQPSLFRRLFGWLGV